MGGGADDETAIAFMSGHRLVFRRNTLGDGPGDFESNNLEWGRNISFLCRIHFQRTCPYP